MNGITPINILELNCQESRSHFYDASMDLHKINYYENSILKNPFLSKNSWVILYSNECQIFHQLQYTLTVKNVNIFIKYSTLLQLRMSIFSLIYSGSV